MTDGFHVPVFDHRRILTVSTCPVGEGGQATVWACEVRDGDVEESPRPGDRLEGRREGSTGRTRMALKVLRPTLAASESERQAFGREAHFLSRISHEHVCKAVGRWTTTTGLPCLVLTWCGMDVSRAMSLKDVGSSSKARRRARERWPSRERLRLLRELGSALDVLHSGVAIDKVVIVHRDLKPDNFGITEDGTLKLYDFGLAVALCEDDADLSDSAEDAVYDLTGETGSRRYMAPEVCRSQPYGPAADVYAYAVAAFEICSLAGKPFATYGVAEHSARVVDKEERPTIPKRWDSRLADLYDAAWTPNHRDRCDMKHVLSVLDDVLATCRRDPTFEPLSSTTRTASCLVM